MEVKLNNQEFEIKDAPEMVENGNANKLKLQIATDMAIRTVQMAFLAEKLNVLKTAVSNVEQALANTEVPSEKHDVLEDKRRELELEVNFISKAYHDAGRSYEKMFIYGVKMLKLPEDKFVELANGGEIDIIDKGDSFAISTDAYEKASDASLAAVDNADEYFQDDLLKKNDLVFDSIDVTAIQDAVNESMVSADKIKVDDFAKVVTSVADDAKEIYKDSIISSDVDDIYSQIISGSLDNSELTEETVEEEIQNDEGIKIVEDVTSQDEVETTISDDNEQNSEFDEIAEIKKFIEEEKARKESLEKDNETAKEELRLAEEAKEKALKEKEVAENAREEAKIKAERYQTKVSVYLEELTALREANAQLVSSATETRSLVEQVNEEVTKTTETTAQIRKEAEGYEASRAEAVNALKEFKRSIVGETEKSADSKGVAK